MSRLSRHYSQSKTVMCSMVQQLDSTLYTSCSTLKNLSKFNLRRLPYHVLSGSDHTISTDRTQKNKSNNALFIFNVKQNEARCSAVSANVECNYSRYVATMVILPTSSLESHDFHVSAKQIWQTAEKKQPEQLGENIGFCLK